MKIKILVSICLVIFISLTSCEKYEDYIEDFDYSIVAFSTQKPLRTVVAYEEMQFKVGVFLGGKRSNNQEESADFTIDPSLLDDSVLDGAGSFTLLPESYYTLSNPDKMIIPEGEFIGDVTINLNRELFTADPLATSNTYALPFKITASTLDSIASGSPDGTLAPRDYSIVVVKYISPYSGTFYQTGVQTETASGTDPVVTEYNNTDLIRNPLMRLSTINASTLRSDRIGTFTNNANNGVQNNSLILTVNGETVDLSVDDSTITNFSGSGTYNPTDRSFNISYSFDKNGSSFDVEEILYLRRPPEEDLTFEEW